MATVSASPTSVPSLAGARRGWAGALVGASLLVLCTASLFIGASSEVSLGALMDGENSTASMLFMVSRVPRTVALVLVGASLGLAGLIMQMLVQNKFVEPSTTGVTEFGSLGMLAAMVFWPGMPVFPRMLLVAAFAMVGTWLFLRVIRAVPVRQLVLVPLVGIMLGGVVGAVTTFFAYRLDLLQSLGQWAQGSFSTVMQGRYELVWLAAAMMAVAWFAADRFSVIGLGEEVATSLGLGYRRVVAVGMVIVSVISAVVLVTVGMLPFLGLVVPNIVSMLVGDNVRRAIPWVAGLGALFVVACDIVARTVRHPYEIPLSVVVGVVGAVLFLWLLLRRRSRAH